MPPRVKPASHTFQRTMTQVFKEHEECILPPFYDDVVIKGFDFWHHYNNVKKILEDVKKAKLTLNALKCFFFQRQINYLGHVISNHTVSLDTDRIQAIRNIPAPFNVKTLRSFLGMAGGGQLSRY